MNGVDTQPILSERVLQERAVTERFLESPGEDSFAELFRILTPQLIGFFRARGCDPARSEDLTQEVMFTVYRKAEQLRDKALFRSWLFKIARNALRRHGGRQSREVETIDLEKVANRLVAASNPIPGTPAFEFLHWMAFLDSCEQEALTMRFIEEWEYHEIAAAKATPIGTLQWRVFNAKKKLAPYLRKPRRFATVVLHK